MLQPRRFLFAEWCRFGKTLTPRIADSSPTPAACQPLAATQRKQDFGYEMAEPIAMVASRHHFRIWKAPFTWKEQEVRGGAGTHDIGFAKDERNGNVTQKIDPLVHGERNIESSRQKVNKTKTLTYYLPANRYKVTGTPPVTDITPMEGCW